MHHLLSSAFQAHEAWATAAFAAGEELLGSPIGGAWFLSGKEFGEPRKGSAEDFVPGWPVVATGNGEEGDGWASWPTVYLSPNHDRLVVVTTVAPTEGDKEENVYIYDL